MSEWKAGGKAMVDLVQGPGDAHTFHIPSSGGPYFLVSASALQPVADPHQALKDAVVEAAKVYMKEGADVALYQELRKAVDAFTAAQTPPKPDLVEVFYEVAGYNLSVCSSQTWKLCRSKPDECACRRYITEGLAAVDAARGAMTPEELAAELERLGTPISGQDEKERGFAQGCAYAASLIRQCLCAKEKPNAE